MDLSSIFKKKNGGNGDGAGKDEFKRDPRKARRFFEHAQTVADARNYDYAIECYVNGLRHEPDNINKHESLRDVSLKRKVNGGKPAGMGERLKTGGPNEIDKMLHAEKIWAMDPLNADLMLGVMKHAVEADAQNEDLNLGEVAYWVGGLVLELGAQQKSKKKLYLEARDLFVRLGAYDKAVEACRRALSLDPSNPQLLRELKDLEAENTMQQGGYSGTQAEQGGYRKFVRSAEKQRILEQEEAITKTDSAADEIIERRRAEYDEDPQDLDRLTKLVDALIARETPTTEKEAMDLLRRAWEESGQYRYKVRAGDLRMKQFSRSLRQAKAQLAKQPDDAELKQKIKDAQRKQMEFELKEYTDRAKNYPTDMGLRFELGKRLYQAGQVDEAIGAFQQAKADPKVRAAAHMFLGSCYLNKGWFEESIDTLRQGIEAHPQDSDRLGMDMRYLLMDALFQSAGKSRDVEQAREAQKVASQILQTDINYRDIRDRMNTIKKLVDELS